MTNSRSRQHFGVVHGMLAINIIMRNSKVEKYIFCCIFSEHKNYLMKTIFKCACHTSSSLLIFLFISARAVASTMFLSAFKVPITASSVGERIQFSIIPSDTCTHKPRVMVGKCSEKRHQQALKFQRKGIIAL